jgi:hypothetical protein
MALAIGADCGGAWNGMHAEPVDARNLKSAPVVLVYPYGTVVDRSGRRFFDEGGGLVHETWEWFERDIHFNPTDAIAYSIHDRHLLPFSCGRAEFRIRAARPGLRPHRWTRGGQPIHLLCAGQIRSQGVSFRIDDRSARIFDCHKSKP